MNKALEVLNERAKELQCVYEVEEVLLKQDLLLPEVFARLLKIIPRGWQFPTVCEVCITYQGKDYATTGYRDTEWIQSSDIIIDNNIVGHIRVVYTQFIRDFGGTQFLPEEQRLLNNITNRLGNYVFHKKLEQTLPLLSKTGASIGLDFSDMQPDILSGTSDEHWKWRFRVAERIARELAMDRFGVKALYLIGSTLDGNAGQGSDIDLIAHVDGDQIRRDLLTAWMDGWSRCLTELNFLKTGYSSQVGLIDLHMIDDQDIENRNSYAVMIGSGDGASHCLRTREDVEA